MSTFILWLAGVAVEALILFVSFRRKLFTKYPLFYAYIASVLFFSIFMFLILLRSHDWYTHWYWIGQLVTLIIGYGVMLEILKQTLSPYPGAERFGTFVILGIFTVIFSYVIIQSLRMPHWSPASSTLEFERDLRGVQALVLVGILGVIFHYRIAIGKNLRGLIYGYGLYIGTSLMSLGLGAYAGSEAATHWNALQTFSYLVSLVIWAAAMWSYQPNPVPRGTGRGPGGVEADYQTLVQKTRDMLDAMRSHITRVARP
jgi:hypothetical protein